MSYPCRQTGHIAHPLWPYFPLAHNHTILACEQFCQWCPGAFKDKRRWETAASLRKHAKCHIEKDSPFTIQSGGKGGRVSIASRNHLVDLQALHTGTPEVQIDLQPADQSASSPRRVDPPAVEADTRTKAGTTSVAPSDDQSVNSLQPDTTTVLEATPKIEAGTGALCAVLCGGSPVV